MTISAPAKTGFIVFYALGYVGAYVALITPVATTLALKIGELDPLGKATSLGIISAIGALFALVLNPLSGALSDRTRSALGRRKPWLIVGTAGGVIALAIVGFAPNLVVVAIGWALAQATFNMVLAALQALLPDQIPLAQRARVSAVLGISQQISPLIGVGLASAVMALGIGFMFLVPAIVGAVLLVLLIVTLRDVDHEDAGKFSFSEFLVGFRIRRGARDFGWAWFGRFFVILGFAIYTTYQVYFITDRLGVATSRVIGVQLLAIVVFSIVLTASAVTAGRISDRTGRRKIFVFLSAGIVAVGMAMLAFTPSIEFFYVAAGVMGLGIGAYFAVDLALVTDVLPDQEHDAAKDMGIFNIANALPQSVAPAIAPVFLGIAGGANYTLLFCVAALFSVIGAILIAPIKAVR
jgi:MFS family permease